MFWAGPTEPTYRDLYPEPPPAGTVPSCAEGGVFGVLCAQIGSVMAAEAIKLVTGIGRAAAGPAAGPGRVGHELAGGPAPPGPGHRPAGQAAGGLSGILRDRRRTGNAPARGVSAELAAMLRERAAGREDFMLVDVREPGEALIVSIDGAELVPRGLVLAGEIDLPRDVPWCSTASRGCARGRCSATSWTAATRRHGTSPAASWAGSNRSSPENPCTEQGQGRASP